MRRLRSLGLRLRLRQSEPPPNLVMRDLPGRALPEPTRRLVEALPDLRLRKKSVELAGDGILWLNCHEGIVPRSRTPVSPSRTWRSPQFQVISQGSRTVTVRADGVCRVLGSAVPKSQAVVSRTPLAAVCQAVPGQLQYGLQ